MKTGICKKSQGYHGISTQLPHTAVLPKIPHSNCCKRVSNRPLRGRRGRFGILLQQWECGIFGRTAVESYIVHLSEVIRCGRFTLASYAFFVAREATGAQENAWPKPRRRHEQPLRPDLSLTIQDNMSLQLHDCFSPSVAAQRRRCRHCLISAGTQPATLPKSHS